MFRNLEIKTQSDWQKVQAEIERQIDQGQGTFKERLASVRIVIHDFLNECLWVIINNKRIRIDDEGKTTSQKVATDREVRSILQKSVDLRYVVGAPCSRGSGRPCLWFTVIVLLLCVCVGLVYYSVFHSGMFTL